MNALIAALLERSRALQLVLSLLLVGGAAAWLHMPKESEPDIAIPIITVTMIHDGISPEDGERLLIRPMESELRGIEGVKEMTAYATEGRATVTLEFDAGFDSEQAMLDVREKVDLAQPELPEETEEPIVDEVNFSLFPVLVVGLAGDVPERELLRIARDLRDDIRSIPTVLDVEIAGEREELVEILIDPSTFESYGINLAEVMPLVDRNNRLVAAGTLDSGVGRVPVKVPGLYETVEDILDTPVKVAGDRVIKVRDVATIRKTFKDSEGYARVGGEPALALEVIKRSGENVIETIEAVRAIVAEEQEHWPEGVEVDFFQDKSGDIREMLLDLQNNLISAIALVMIVILGALGWRTAALVGIAIPGSFLTGLLILDLMGLTINIVVLFSLILAVGMLVDGAIVVTEFADRKMLEGHHRRDAYREASQRMALPIFSSTLTTLAAFLPLLFWPGIVGEFMKYMPITLICVLSASLLMALIFVPAIGAIIGKPGVGNPETLKALAASEHGNLEELRGITGAYTRTLHKALNHPWLIVISAVFIFFASYWAYGSFGRGVEFFPDVEPDRATFAIKMRGNFSIEELDKTVREVESRILDMSEFATIYTRSGINFQGGMEGNTEDTHGVILVEFADWQTRRTANEILAEVHERLEDIPGIVVELRKEEGGPPGGKPVQIQLRSRFPSLLDPAVDIVRAKFESMEGLKDIEDTRPVPGIEWRVDVDRAQASRYGADIAAVGDIIQFVTTGLEVDDYRPDETDDEVEIRIRYPLDRRGLEQIGGLRVPTFVGLVPVSNFVTWKPAPKVGQIERSDSRRVLSVRADVEPEVLPADKVDELKAWLDSGEAGLDPRVEVVFKGEDEDQREAEAFLGKAFLVALAIMAIILVAQFNSFYHAFLILTAVIFSTVGVFLGLLITHQPFGIVMNGIGVIALAGIVVNNNIVLIDTFHILRQKGFEPLDAVLRTGAQRLRPVLLTTVTTILGLIPMVFALNINFLSREVTYGAPSTQWWTQLATSVAFGLAFSTLLTLGLTPALLLIGERVQARFRR